MIQEIAEALAQSWSNFTGAFVLFVPRLVAATIIFAGGFIIAVVARRIVRSTLVSLHFERLVARTGASEMLRKAGLPGARLLSGTIRLLVIAFAVVMALEQLGLATAVVLTAFAITFGALMLGLAIAFGLGGRDAAKQLLDQHLRAQQERKPDATPHL